MHPTDSISPINRLPNELVEHILGYCTIPPLPNACKTWRELLDNCMFSLYKGIANFHFPKGNSTEQALILDRIYKLESQQASQVKVYQIFKQVFTLAKSPSLLECEGELKENKNLTLSNYSYYFSFILNSNRILLWKNLPRGKKYLSQEEVKHLPLEKKGERFKGWIEEHCKEITRLDLKVSNLSFFPPEIGQLSQLEMLYLNQNQLTTIPLELEWLSRLHVLKL